MSMIKQIFSRKHGKKVWQVDIRVNKKRIRATLFTKADAESVAYKLQHDHSLKKFGIRTVGHAPALSDLFSRRCAIIDNRRERTRALRVMRHGEIDNLLWAHIGTERIKVLGTKTNKTRYVPITPVIAEVLAARKAATRSRYVFTAGGNTPPNFYRILGDACKAVGVPYGDERNGIRMHDCRHTATTDLLQAGIDLSTVQAITGHSDRTMILYYSHPTGESLERAAKVLNKVADLKVA